jgi:hypothetical protein
VNLNGDSGTGATLSVSVAIGVAPYTPVNRNAGREISPGVRFSRISGKDFRQVRQGKLAAP